MTLAGAEGSDMETWIMNQNHARGDDRPHKPKKSCMVERGMHSRDVIGFYEGRQLRSVPMILPGVHTSKRQNL